MPQSQNSAKSSSFRQSQFRWTKDPTFYPLARPAMEAPPERHAYVTALAPDNKSRTDAMWWEFAPGLFKQPPGRMAR